MKPVKEILRDYENLLVEIMGARKVSIGSLHNYFDLHIKVSQTEKRYRELQEYLASEVGVEPEGGLANGAVEDKIQRALLRLVAANNDLADKSENRITYYEESPTENKECYLRWVELNNALKEAKLLAQPQLRITTTTNNHNTRML